jgi:uncharacterized protein (DUF1778 family)
MQGEPKYAQLQIRLSAADKAAIQRAARRAGQDMSAWVLDRLLPRPREKFQALAATLVATDRPAFALAELNDFLSNCTAAELETAIADAPRLPRQPELANYLAAMVEYAAGRLDVALPVWLQDIAPLRKAWFGSDLASLRLHLLTQSPPPFRRRNIYIDASLGNRV